MKTTTVVPSASFLLERSWFRRVPRRQRRGLKSLFCSGGAHDSNKWPKPRLPSTPVTPDEATAEKVVDKKAWKERLRRSSQGRKGKVIFPWRHDTELLDRLVDPNIEGGVLGPGIAVPMPWFLKHVFMQVSAVHLNVPWYSVLLDSKWRQELADSSAFAFSQAVAGVLSNTYKVASDEIVSDDGSIEFCTTTTADDNEEGNGDTPKDEGGAAFKETLGNDDPSGKWLENDFDQADDEDTSPRVEYMMEGKLRKLYEASHEFGKDQLRVQLQMNPLHCELLSLLFIPYVTRNALKEAPSLKHKFRNMFRELQEKTINEDGEPVSVIQVTREAFRIGDEYTKSRVQYKQGDDFVFLESTVVAQVLLTCNEAFSVSDVTTGILLQGDGRTQRVYHLVRLEVVVKEKIPKSGGKPKFLVESWQIVDWDDLVGGNLWCYGTEH